MGRSSFPAAKSMVAADKPTAMPSTTVDFFKATPVKSQETPRKIAMYLIRQGRESRRAAKRWTSQISDLRSQIRSQIFQISDAGSRASILAICTWGRGRGYLSSSSRLTHWRESLTTGRTVPRDTLENLEFVLTMRQRMGNASEHAWRRGFHRQSIGVIGGQRDELPHSGPSSLGGTLLDEPAVAVLDAEGSTPQQRNRRFLFRRRDAIGQSRGIRLAVISNRADQALRRARRADERAQFHQR